MNRCLSLPALVAALVTALALAPARAEYPDRPVRLVVPFAVGGGTDIVARTMAQALATHWGQRVVVENLAGADGLIGTQKVLNAPADGHTLLVQLNQMAASFRNELVEKGDATGPEIDSQIARAREYFVPMLISMAIFGYLIIGALFTTVLSFVLSRKHVGAQAS